MNLLSWKTVDRRREKNIRYTDSQFVWGYDLDLEDLSELIGRFNEQTISSVEENRLYKYTMTMMNIVLENPKVHPRSMEETDSLTDHMFMKVWGALRYIKRGANPYSYLYRSGITAVSEFYKKRYKDREREEVLNEHLERCYDEYMSEFADHKTPIATSEY